MNIILPLHPSVTKDECGECPRGITRTSNRWCNVFGDVHNGKRLPACLAASAEAAHVERDARLGALVRILPADEWSLITGGSLGLPAPMVAPYDRIADTVDAIATALRSEVTDAG